MLRSWHFSMLVTAFLCPKFQEDGNGGLGANNSVMSSAGAGRKHAHWKLLTPAALRHLQGKWEEKWDRKEHSDQCCRKTGTMNACESKIQQEIKKKREINMRAKDGHIRPGACQQGEQAVKNLLGVWLRSFHLNWELQLWGSPWRKWCYWDYALLSETTSLQLRGEEYN